MTIIKNAFKIMQDVQKEIAQDEKNLKRAMTVGMRKVTNGAKDAIRNNVRSSGLGNKLATSWRGNTFPNGAKTSFHPTGFLYSNAPHIIEAFETGATVTAQGGKYLAIPTKFAMRKVGRNRLTPEIWIKAGFPPLQFIKTKTGGILVSSGFRSKSLKTFRTGKSFRGGTKENLVMFILVKSVKHKKKLNSETIAFDWFSKYPDFVDEIMESYG